MSQEELDEYNNFRFFFSKAFLETVPKAYGTRVDLEEKDLYLLLESGLVQRVDNVDQGLGMHLYCVAEPHKTRRRLIVHTVDINDFTEDSCPTTSFTEFQTMIETYIDTLAWTADLKSAYNQIPLDEDAKPFFSFNSKIGMLCLKTVATGQRQCVGYCNCVSRALTKQTLLVAQAGHGECYIDNFCFKGSNMAMARRLVCVFFILAQQLNTTVNEKQHDVLKSIGQPFDYRGVRFSGKAVCMTKKTSTKLIHAQQELENWQTWTFEKALSIFGLCIFASSVVKCNLCEYYIIYKYFRRRNQQLVDNLDAANIWKCMLQSWSSWIKALLQGTRVKTAEHPCCILYTDASLMGWGAIRIDSGKMRGTGGPWPKCYMSWRIHINELEAAAVHNGLREMVSPGEVVHLRIDNTTILYNLQKRRSRNFHINNRLRTIIDKWRLASVQYVRSEDNIADALSRANYVVPASTPAEALDQAEVPDEKE